MERLDIVDETGEPTGETVERTQAHRLGVRHRTSHVWLLRRGQQGIEVLLQKRSDDKDSFPGCYDISSAGHIPAGQGFVESALRELQEELGVLARPEQLHLCGQRSFSLDAVFHGLPFHDRQVSNVYALWYDAPAESFTVQQSEISMVRWMELSACMEMVLRGSPSNCIYSEELAMLERYLAKDAVRPGAKEKQTRA